MTFVHPFCEPTFISRENWDSVISHILDLEVSEKFRTGRHEFSVMSDHELQDLDAAVANVRCYSEKQVGDVSFCFLQKMLCEEKRIRESESRHDRLKRAGRSTALDIRAALDEEKSKALAWYHAEGERWGSVHLSALYGVLPHDDRVVLAYRAEHSPTH